MAIGNFGEIVFEVNSDKKLAFEELDVSTKARWVKHEVANMKPRSEFLSDGDSSTKLSINLKAINGVNPWNELLKLVDMRSNGNVETLMIGSKLIGKFYIETLNYKTNKIDNQGAIWEIKVDLGLNEYCDEVYVAKTTTTPKTVAVVSQKTTETKKKEKPKITTKNTTKGTETIVYETGKTKKIGQSLEQK